MRRMRLISLALMLCMVLPCTVHAANAVSGAAPGAPKKVTALSKIKLPSDGKHQTRVTDTIKWSAVSGAKEYRIYMRETWTDGRKGKWKRIAVTKSSVRSIRNIRTIPVLDKMMCDGVFKRIEYSVVPYNAAGKGQRTVSNPVTTVRYFRRS